MQQCASPGQEESPNGTQRKRTTSHPRRLSGPNYQTFGSNSVEKSQHGSKYGSNVALEEDCETSSNPFSNSALRDFFTVLALSLHAIFEGLAVGLEKDTNDVWILYAGNYELFS